MKCDLKQKLWVSLCKYSKYSIASVSIQEKINEIIQLLIFIEMSLIQGIYGVVRLLSFNMPK